MRMMEPGMELQLCALKVCWITLSQPLTVITSK